MRAPSRTRSQPLGHPPSRRFGSSLPGWTGRLLGFLIWPLLAAGLPAEAAETLSVPTPDYAAWIAACRKLPANRELGDRLAPKALLPLRRYADFAATLAPFLDLCRTGALARTGAWLDALPQATTFFNLETAYFSEPETPFQPFAQRVRVSAGTRVFVHGDLHGDIHALMAYLDALNRAGDLDGFRVARPEVRLLFLGDYTDRGRHGVEVLYTLLRLKLASPDQVWLVRGNHEDVSLVARYGFLAEATGKYGREFDARRVARLYDFLPAVLYLVTGTNVVQCNHGGLEPGYQPDRLLAAPEPVEYQLLGRLEQRRFLASHRAWVAAQPAGTRRQLESAWVDFVPQSPTTPSVLGFLWNDFTAVSGEPQFSVDPGRAFVYGDQLTRLVLDTDRPPAPGASPRLRAVFRGHQHAAELNPLMSRLLASHGIFRHWQTNDGPGALEAKPQTLARLIETEPLRALPDGSVWTFNVSPDSVYGIGCGFTFDTAGEVVTAARWEDWRLRVMNLEVPALR